MNEAFGEANLIYLAINFVRLVRHQEIVLKSSDQFSGIGLIE